MRPANYYRGALVPGLKPATAGEEAEADEDANPERPVAEPAELAKYLTLAIEQFEQRFAITAEEKLEALRQVVKGLEPRARAGRAGK